MRIIVKESEHNIRLRFPSRLILNRFTAAALCREAEKYGVKISPSQMRVLIKALHHYRKTHPDWVLAEVRSGEDGYVLVKL